MTISPWLYRLLVCLFLMPIGAAFAQTIKIDPTSASVGVTATRTFKGTVTGLANTAVTYSVVGGASQGSIDQTGLYTAPATVPAQNPVSVKVTAQGQTSLTATAFVTILTPGATLTSVSPNPLPTGNYTVTLTGSGFLAGATVLNTSNGTAVQVPTSTVTANTIVASGYQASAPNATFTVVNPSAVPSNGVTVPVSGGGTTYSLSVINGTGGGSYAAGTTVAITANAPPQGQTFVNWTGATVANSTAASTTLTMPAGTTTVTANYSGGTTNHTLTVVGGTGSGSYAPGTTVAITATIPPNSLFVNWTGATVANATAASTTITMPSVDTSVTANFTAAPTIPFPVQSHPRLWITTADVTKLRTWATSSNPYYAQGMSKVLADCVNTYNTQFFPGGVQNANWPDPGDSQGYVGPQTEQYAMILAFNAQIDPNAANRIKYAQMARNLLMVAFNQAAQGPLANAPFRDPMFATYNRANEAGQDWALAVDWIYSIKDAQNHNILTNADKATIRTAFMYWATACLNASTAYGDHPVPVGATNSLSLLPGNQPYRMAMNNYYLGHARLITMMSLSIDPVDDPAIDGTQPLSTLGNSLRSYILNATGAWLYQEYAMMGEPNNVASEYGIGGTGAGFGIASGGMPPEGMLYGHSYGFILGQLLALKTAGFGSVQNGGQQARLGTAPVWDRFVKGTISSLVASSQTFAVESYLGPVFQFASYGDLLRLWVTPDFTNPYALLTLLDKANGSVAHVNESRWVALNAIPNGANGIMSNIAQPWTWGADMSLLNFLLMDPTASAPTDPRPTYPLFYVDPAAGRVVAHGDWGLNNTMFDYRASWESINHQDGDGGQFEFRRNNEWLTKEMSNYDNNAVGMTTRYHNSLGIQNWCANGTPNLSWFEAGEWANGSQFILGLNQGDPVTVTSSGANYVYATSDLTKLYNRPDQYTAANAAIDVKQATRSILWLNNDYIVVYDRATTNHSGLFKTFNLSLQTPPVINGNVATDTLASGQQLFVQSLLPKNNSMTYAEAASTLNPIADLEPTKYILTTQDPTKPADTRFLHVLQGADATTSMAAATYLANVTGTPCDGAQFGSTAVFFLTNSTDVFKTTTFLVPANVHTIMIAGVRSRGQYKVTTVSGAKGVTVTVTPATGVAADAAGVLTASF